MTVHELNPRVAIDPQDKVVYVDDQVEIRVYNVDDTPVMAIKHTFNEHTAYIPVDLITERDAELPHHENHQQFIGDLNGERVSG